MPFQIEIVKQDLTQANTEAIVNAANNHLWMGSGVAGAIKAAGGKSIEEQAIAKGPILPGGAIFTSAGTLRFKAVIHAAVMGQDFRTSDKLIRQATVASLNVAEQLGLTSVAFPAFGTGVGGFPMRACAHLMIHTVDGYQPLAKSLQRVQFCLLDEYGEMLFQETLTKLRR